MKVKVFTSTTMQDAMNQVKQELGRDAVILQTRRFKKGGIFGWWGKEMVEVMAATDTPPFAAATEKRTAPPVDYPQPPLPVENSPKTAALQFELAGMRKMLVQVLHKMPQAEHKKGPLIDLLVRNDVEPAVAESLLKDVPDDPALTDALAAKAILEERIIHFLQRAEGIHVPDSGCKAVAFIGPTGVGKTTTIAKLAAHFAIMKGYKVAMVAADTYRISAVEQLKTYSDIIGVPIEVVYSPAELKDALAKNQDKQLILIDTTGRSPRNHYQIAELKAFLEAVPDIEIHLVLSTTTKYKDALEIATKFSVCSPHKLLFTKVDEASNVGTIINLLHQFPTTLSYITNGQTVPDDIELADPQKLAELMLRDSTYV